MKNLMSLLSRPVGLFLAERDRWVLWLPVLFGFGIAVYFSLAMEPPLWLGPAGVAAVLAAAFFVRKSGREWGGAGFGVLVMAGMVAAGFTAAQWRTAGVSAPVLEKRIGPTTVSGRVIGVESFTDSRRITIERPRISNLRLGLEPEKVRLKLRGNQPRISPGQWLRVRAILTPPPPPAQPGGFDFQRHSYFRQLGGYGFSIGTAEIIGDGKDGLDFLTLGLARVRQAVTERVLAALDGPAGAVAAALMTGDRSSIPGALMDSMRDSGLAHLLAISGLHIGLMAGILFFGLRVLLALSAPLALHFPIKKWAAAAAIAGAFAYALIAGATVPTQRAFLMVGLVLLAVLVDRKGLSVRLVAWAALVIMVLRPESLLGASFQMSFAAVIALIAAYEWISERRRKADYVDRRLPAWARGVGLYLAGVALTTVIAGAATAPFAIYHFNRFADYGLAANLMAVPVTALWVMPWAVAAFVLMPFGLEGLALTPMGWGLEVVIAVAEIVSSWPGAVTLLPSMPTMALAAVAIGGLWLCLWRRRWRILGLAGIALGLAAIAVIQPPDILIDGGGRLMAVRSADGSVAVSSQRRARFIRQIWLRRFGQDQALAKWPATGTSPDQRLSCDLQGCLYRAGGRTAALAYGEGALAEDCWAVDVVVSVVPVRRACPASVGVVDRFDLWRLGGHALWLNENGVRIETVNGARGNRPWVIMPGRAKR
jgi:competence protein ComEC